MSVLDLNDADAIRKPTPQLDRVWLIGLVLIAGLGFASGFINQLFGQLELQPPAQEADPAVAAVRPLPIAPIVQPALQVAPVQPAPVAPPKLDVPDPVAAPPQAAAPDVAAAAATASAPAGEPTAATPAEPVPEPEEPPSA
jgi:hypothetical protein